MSNRTRTTIVGIIGFALGVLVSSAWNMQSDGDRNYRIRAETEESKNATLERKIHVLESERAATYKTLGVSTEPETERPISGPPTRSSTVLSPPPPGDVSETPSTPTPAPGSDDADSNDQAKILVGKVISLADGDTLTVLDSMNTQHKIRLEGIDAPERNQDYGTKSREALAEKVFEKQVRVDVSGTDRYGRKLGHIYIAERWINKELVAEGWAWHYKNYSSDADLAAAEVEARHDKLGLWADSQAPQPPWEFRSKPKSAADEITK